MGLSDGANDTRERPGPRLLALMQGAGIGLQRTKPSAKTAGRPQLDQLGGGGIWV